MKLLVAIFALLFSAGQAYAFQETELPSAAAPGARVDAPAADYAAPDVKAPGEEGNSITIPGFGKVGTLPKLDFGLELLYQEDEPKAVTPQGDDGLSIKGRLKHSF